MSWLDILKGVGQGVQTYAPVVNQIYQASKPVIGAGLYGAGLNQIFDANARNQKAFFARQADEMRNQALYNQKREDQYRQRLALMDAEQQRQDAMLRQRQAQFQGSLERAKQQPQDIQSQYQSILERYARQSPSAGDIAAPASDRAPAVVKESLARERSKRGDARAKQTAARAKMLAPQMAMASGALADADATSALRSMAGRAQDSARVGNKEQTMFVSPQLYPSGQLGFDPGADIASALGGMMMNYGANMLYPSPTIDWSSLFGGSAGAPSTGQTGNAYQYRPGPIRRRYP